mmetsp:Transcript_24997/g.27572  ORF Transcript_24997/g.27572 Transcript_24997/m.27572 type:complete len:205 (+) Transcript_24997:33-647(+)
MYVTSDSHLIQLINVSLIYCCQVVCRTLVVDNVLAHLFLVRIDTEHVKLFQHKKERSHDTNGPSNNKKYSNKLTKQKAGISRSISPFIEPASMPCLGKGFSNARWLGEEARCNASPHTIEEVNRNSINSIINLELYKEFGSSYINPARNYSNQHRSPWFNYSTAGSNPNKSTEYTIHGHCKVIFGLTRQIKSNQCISKHGAHAS